MAASRSLPIPFSGGANPMSSFMKAGAAGSIGAGVGGLLGQLFGSSPADAASPYLDQISGVAKQYLEPYSQAGTSQIQPLQEQYNTLMNNPDQFLNKVGAGYQQSPGYQWRVKQSIDAANRAAAAGGMLGSPMEQEQLAGTVGHLADQDYYDYVDHVLGLYQRGLTGGENMFGTGANASSSLSQALIQSLISQANNAYEGQAAENAGFGDALGSLAGGAAMLAFL